MTKRQERAEEEREMQQELDSGGSPQMAEQKQDIKTGQDEARQDMFDDINAES